MTDHEEQTEEYAVCSRLDICARPDKGKIVWSILQKIQAALLTIGLALGAIYVALRMESYFASRSAIERFESAEPAVAAEEVQGNENNPQAVALQPADTDFRDWGEGRVRAYQESAKKRFAALLAVMTIPSVHVNAPVFDGTDALTLNHAVGRIAGTAMPGEGGNVGIAGHRDGFFRGLKDIKQGDEIDLKTHTGTDVYTVASIQIVTPRDVSVLRPQERPALTLVTCYPFYFIGSAPKRFVVTAFLTQHSTARQTTSKARLNPQPNNPALEEQ